MIKEYSRMGRYHSDLHGENQDVVCHGSNDRFSVISLADGVSTCSQAKAGAQIASREITDLLLKKGDYFLEFDPDQTSRFVLSHILYELKDRADEEQEDVKEYSSTVSSVLLDKKEKKMLCFNLGDGIILAVRNGKCRILAVPSDSTKGCCVTTTNRAETMTSVDVVDAEDLDAVMIFSDGAWNLLYENGRMKPEISGLLSEEDFNGLKKYLAEQEGYDDSSFIAMDIPQKRRKAS